MKLVLALLFLLPSGQTVTAVWDATCITEITKTENTRLVAPVDKDGVPDMKRAKLEGVTVTYTKNCMRFDISR